MLTVGDTFPAFSLKACVATDVDHAFATVTEHTYAGKWQVVFFWPKDFTFICPTEIAEFGRLANDFAARDAQVLGASIDNEYVHLAWREARPELADLPFPMLSDLKRELAGALGILDRAEGVALRATFIVDPEGIIRFVSVNDLGQGRNVEEVLRVLEALQTGELTACNWRPGQRTLGSAA